MIDLKCIFSNLKYAMAHLDLGHLVKTTIVYDDLMAPSGCPDALARYRHTRFDNLCFL